MMLREGLYYRWSRSRHHAHAIVVGRDPEIAAPRIYVVVFAGVVVACAASGSILPAMFVVLPRFYAGPLSQLFNLTQHTGLYEDVYDHRLNTRTVLTNPVLDFLYANMN